ncbi:MAG: hypothetical protein ACON4T_03725 [Synechococcus sp.]
MILLLALMTAAVASWAVPFRYPGAGLDPSWAQALVAATDSGRVFGKDIIFTYGPLHQAVTAQVSTNLVPLIFSRLVFTGVWLIAQIVIGIFIGFWAELSIASAALISAGSHADLVFYLIPLVGVVSLATTGLRTKDGERFPPFLLSVTLLSGSLLATLVKLSYLGACIPFFAYVLGIYAFDAFRDKTPPSFWRLFAIIFCPLLVLVVAWSVTAHAPVGDLLHYYLGPNLDIIKGYSDAMSYGDSERSGLLIRLYWLSSIALLVLLSTLILAVKINRAVVQKFARQPTSALALVCFSLLLWVVFKSSLVRDDSGHSLLGGLFLVSSLFVIVGFSGRRLPDSLLAENGGYLGLGLIIPLLTAGHLAFLSGYRFSSSIPLKYTEGFFHSWRLLSPGGQKKLIAKRQTALDVIKNNSEDYRIRQGLSADIIPWDISRLIANGLDYKPRPIPQSYSVYSRKLQEINRRFFSDPLASPDWLIVGIKKIDGRLPIGLDSSTLSSIKRFYSLSHQGSRGSLVFRKKPGLVAETSASAPKNCSSNAKGQLEWIKIGENYWESRPLEIPQGNGGFVILDADLQDSLSRSLLSTLYRPSPVVIQYFNAAGEVVDSRRLIPKAVRDMIVYPVINNNEQFLRFVYLGASSSQGEIVSLKLATRNRTAPFSNSAYTLFSGCTSS